MLLFLLFFTGMLAGTVDAIAGGGGLISLPVLLTVGLPPHLAFGTNKLQSTIGTFMATLKYYKHGLISFRSAYIGIIFGFLGAVSGAIASQLMSVEILSKIVPILLFIILLYSIFSPKFGISETKARLSEFVVYMIFGFALGFYDGFFGPGTGAFWVFILTFFLGFNLIKATAYTKVFNLNSNIVATVCFALGGNIDYRLGLCMAAGSLIGGRLGAYLTIVKGARLVRPLFLSVVSLTIITLIYKSYFNSFYVFTEHHVLMLSTILFGLIISISLSLFRVWKNRNVVE